MNQKNSAGVKRGRLTDDEKARIDQIALSMKVPSPGLVASRLNRNRSTIAWYMLVNGLWKPPLYSSRSRPVRDRRGVLRVPYTKPEDTMMTALRRKRLGYSEIASRLNAEFGTTRNAHSIHVRLTILAAAGIE
jgi:hypothetical protein